jgi:hypothetical protein
MLICSLVCAVILGCIIKNQYKKFMLLKFIKKVEIIWCNLFYYVGELWACFPVQATTLIKSSVLFGFFILFILMWSQTFRQSLLLLPYKFILDTFEGLMIFFLFNDCSKYMSRGYVIDFFVWLMFIDWTICMENIQRTFDKVYDYNMKDSDIEIEALQSYGGSTSLKSKIIYDEVNSTLIIITCKI